MDFRAAPRFARVRQTERVESYATGLKAREESKGEKSESLADLSHLLVRTDSGANGLGARGWRLGVVGAGMESGPPPGDQSGRADTGA